MSFSEFEACLDTPDGKAFENALAKAAIDGEWLIVEQILRQLTEGIPDKQLKLTLLHDINYDAITCDSWPNIQRAVLLGMPTHLVFQIDGDALYDVLDPENDAPDDDRAVGLNVALAEQGSISDARAHGEALAAKAAARSWSVQAYGRPAAAYLKGLNHVYRAMRVALFDDADKYPQRTSMAMYRICGWWIGLAVNRHMARFCTEWAIDPIIPIFVSCNLGGGRLLGWHIPAGAQRVQALPVHTGQEQRKKSSELSASAMLHRLESDVRYRVCHLGHESTPDDKAFLSERYFKGADPQPWFDRYKAKPWNASRPPEPLTEEDIAYRANYVREQQESRIANAARREKSKRENSTASARMQMVDEFQQEFRQRDEARHLARQHQTGNRRANRKTAAHEEEARAMFQDIEAMIGGILSERGNPAGAQMRSARKLVSTLFKVLK